MIQNSDGSVWGCMEFWFWQKPCQWFSLPWQVAYLLHKKSILDNFMISIKQYMLCLFETHLWESHHAVWTQRKLCNTGLVRPHQCHHCIMHTIQIRDGKGKGFRAIQSNTRPRLLYLSRLQCTRTKPYMDRWTTNDLWCQSDQKVQWSKRKPCPPIPGQPYCDNCKIPGHRIKDCYLPSGMMHGKSHKSKSKKEEEMKDINLKLKDESKDKGKAKPRWANQHYKLPICDS